MQHPTFPKRCHRVLACALLTAAAALACVPAAAAEPAKPAKPRAPAATSKPAAKPADPIMTRAELRECLAQQDRNRAQASELTQEQEKLNAEKAALQKQADELKEQVATIDRTSAEAVAKYNEQVAAREAAVEALIGRTTEFNGRVEAAQKARSSYVTSCENRRFDERDEAAIRSGK